MTIPPQEKLSDYTIRVANPSQAEQHVRGAFAIWHKGTTWEEFSEVGRREREETEWGRDGAFLTWVLVRSDDVEDDIYAGCETYRRRGWVKRKGSNDVEDGYIYGIASVITPKQHLRNGYATRLLSLLHHELGPSATIPSLPREWGMEPSIPSDVSPKVPKAIGSILWSDVGSKFYSKCKMSVDRPGWVVEDSQNTELVWKIIPPSSAQPLDENVDWLYKEDFASIGEEIGSSIKQKLKKTDTSERSIFVHDPATPGLLSFVPVRGSWSRPSLENKPIGLRIRSSTGDSADDTIVLFALLNLSIGSRFMITLVHNLKSSQLPTVLQALDSLATEAGHKEGWVWDLGLSGDLVEAWKNQPGREVVAKRRDEIGGHLLGVAWYGAEEEKGEMIKGEMWTWC
ncbi:hypothetical protein CI109_103383 [Kwoniella shandongensis]|uniref:Uncharacterized protein n=1 Tax=Kwoniella shandongensis TaxID=1734106 RepID=A0A5M6BZA5_9TREE|nr:uncharacterized protein CI109_004464 [Kwoniella shandongensis]KAA5527172.1 hypothetical protein CI109_004464 [Kwoniella shandongensis]